MLRAWGVRKITLLDSGRVSMSNPLRQSPYTLDDCLNGGEFKAIAAVKSLRRIFPAVIVLTRRNTLTGVEYRDDPTIFAWEIINEPRCITDKSGDTLQQILVV